MSGVESEFLVSICLESVRATLSVPDDDVLGGQPTSIRPRSVRLKATIQILEAFQPVIAHQGHWSIQHRQEPYRHLLKAIATHRVADRPDRFEPRMTKRRPKNYNRLTRPRKEIKLDMIK